MRLVFRMRVGNAKQEINTAQKMKFSIKDFFSKCDQIAVFCGFCQIYWINP